MVSAAIQLCSPSFVMRRTEVAPETASATAAASPIGRTPYNYRGAIQYAIAILTI